MKADNCAGSRKQPSRLAVCGIGFGTTCGSGAGPTCPIKVADRTLPVTGGTAWCHAANVASNVYLPVGDQGNVSKTDRGIFTKCAMAQARRNCAFANSANR